MITTIRYLLPGNEKPVYYASRGGADALVFDHTLWSDSRNARGRRLTREPAATRLKQGFAIVNVWRSIAGHVLNSPLALCDASTGAGKYGIPPVGVFLIK